MSYKMPAFVNPDGEEPEFDLWSPFVDDRDQPAIPACLSCFCIFVPNFDGEPTRYVAEGTPAHDCECHALKV
jgi:hypothetical protein